jgi:hypothetical protein
MRNLTEEEIEGTYDELEKMYVPIEARPDFGLPYARERLTICRAMQDRLQDLRLKTARAYSWVQEQLIFRKSQAQLAGSDQEKEQLKIQIAELEQLKLSHGTLSRMISAQSAVLTSTNRDIKTLTDVIIKQMRLNAGGGIDPHDADGADEPLIQTVDLAALGQPPLEDQAAQYFATSDQMQYAGSQGSDEDAGGGAPSVPQEREIREPDTESLPAPNAPAVPEPTSAPEPPPPPAAAPVGTVGTIDDLAALFNAPLTSAAPVTAAQTPQTIVTSPAVEVADFDAPLTVTESLPARGMALPDLSAVPIESLFEEMTNGQTAADRAF